MKHHALASSASSPFTMTLIVQLLIAFIIFVGLVHYLWIAYQNHLTKKMTKTGVLLEVSFEKASEKDPFSIEQVWSYFHSLYLPWHKRLFQAQPYISFEIKAETDGGKKTDEISFNFWIPEQYESLVRSRLKGAYPDARIDKLEEDYIPDLNDRGRNYETAQIGLGEHSAFSIKTFKDFTSDPLASITAAMSGLENKEIAIMQVMVRPISSSWRTKAARILHRYENSNRRPSQLPEWTNVLQAIFGVIFTVFDEFLTGLFATKMPEIKVSNEKSSMDSQAQKDMLEKVSRYPFSVQIRVLAGSPHGNMDARKRVDNIVASFKELDGPTNYFKKEFIIRKKQTHINISNRFFNVINNDTILSSSELSGFAHLPNKDMNIPGLKKSLSKIIMAPTGISDKSSFATSGDRIIGLDEDARMRHVYVAGMTGVGKSVLLENMIIDDIRNGKGVCVIDPHGELIDEILRKVSTTREDIYVLDPSDIQHPFGMNLLELTSNDPNRREMEKVLVIDSFLTVMKRVFGSGAIGPNTDDIFRMSASAVLDAPDGGGLLEVLLMLTSESYRSRIIPFIKDPIVEDYWKTVFPSLASNKNYLVQNLNAPLNKIRRFIANGLVANIICQPESTFNIANAINSGSVILARFSRGDMGFENSALLGSMLIAKIQIAAMQRVNIPMEERVPTYLYVDEFQNFVGDSSGARSFAEILSEARKYRLGLIMAHQYIDQLRQDGSNFLLSAIFNNCGTTLTFRVGPTDAEFYEKVYLDKEINSGFKATDLANLDKYHVAARVMKTDKTPSHPFTAKTNPPVEADKDANPDVILERSRRKIGRPYDEVRTSIKKRMTMMDNIANMMN